MPPRKIVIGRCNGCYSYCHCCYVFVANVICRHSYALHAYQFMHFSNMVICVCCTLKHTQRAHPFTINAQIPEQVVFSDHLSKHWEIVTMHSLRTIQIYAKIHPALLRSLHKGTRIDTTYYKCKTTTSALLNSLSDMFCAHYTQLQFNCFDCNHSIISLFGCQRIMAKRNRWLLAWIVIVCIHHRQSFNL